MMIMMMMMIMLMMMMMMYSLQFHTIATRRFSALSRRVWAVLLTIDNSLNSVSNPHQQSN